LRYSSSRTTLSSELQPSSMILPYFYSIDISRLFIVSLTHLTCMKLDWLYSLLPCLIWIWRYLEHHERNPDLDRSETLGQFVSSHGYSKFFQDAYLVRLLSALLYVCTPARALFLPIVNELWKKIYIFVADSNVCVHLVLSVTRGVELPGFPCALVLPWQSPSWGASFIILCFLSWFIGHNKNSITSFICRLAIWSPPLAHCQGLFGVLCEQGTESFFRRKGNWTFSPSKGAIIQNSCWLVPI
jgi:hypothetical protein